MQSRLEIVLLGLIIIAGLMVLPAAAGYPTMLSMTPQIGTQGTDVPITITGYNFEQGAWVDFEDYPNWQHFMTVMYPSVSADGTTITFTLSIPPGAPSGYWDVFVHNPGNMNDGREGWFITGGLTPTFTSISPHGGSQGGTISPSITGTNFMYGATVTFSGHTGSVPSASSASVYNYGTYLYPAVDVPADAAAGSWSMTITNPDGGGSVTIPDAFTVTIPPSITSITPDRGVLGTTVPFTIKGSGFQQGPEVYCSYNCGEYGLDASDITVSDDGTTVTGTITIPSDAYTECAYHVMFYNPYENGGGYAEVPFDVTAPGLGSCTDVILDTTTVLNAANGDLDLDIGTTGNSAGTDVLWTEVPSIEMVPENGAKIVNLGPMDNFDAITIDDLAGYSYGSTPIPGEEIFSGDVFAVQTNLGNLTKVLVNFREGSALSLRLVTYSVNACQDDAYQALEPFLPGGPGLPPDASLYVSDSPIPANTNVNQWGDPSEGRFHKTGAEASWLFLYDPDPKANWEHDVIYYFVGVEDRAVDQYPASTPPGGIKMHWFKGVVRTVESTNDLGSGYSGGFTGYGGGSASCENIECTHCYALLVSGGFDQANNFNRYWEDLSAMYRTLRQTYCYPEDHIYVLMSDGNEGAVDQRTGDTTYAVSPTDLDNNGRNDIYGPARKADLEQMLLALSGDVPVSGIHTLTPDDDLFIFTTNHGGLDPAGTGKVRLWLWDQQFIWASDFVYDLSNSVARSITMTMEQCYSGGFVDPFMAGAGSQTRVIGTAASATQPSYGNDFSFYWIDGMVGAANVAPTADSDPTLLSLRDGFLYAEAKDPSAAQGKETPVYKGGTPDTGASFGLSSCALCLPPKAIEDGCTNCQTPTDREPKDGVFEDLNGDGQFTMDDVVLFFNHFDWIKANEPACDFDPNGNKRVDLADVVQLYTEVRP